MFRNREDAGRRLGQELQRWTMHDPLVLGIPRGGVAVAAAVAQELDADLDVTLTRKLGAPSRPEVAVGAVSEDGLVYLNHQARGWGAALRDHLVRERDRQLREIARCARLYRGERPLGPVAGRTVIVVDDAIATGATMIATLRMVAERRPLEVIVAVPVAAAAHLEEVRIWCDDVLCLRTPDDLPALSAFYHDFPEVSEDEVRRLLRAAQERAAAGPIAPDHLL